MNPQPPTNHESPARVTIYHNPRCSKSRTALQLLCDRGIEPTVVEYLQTPPDAKTLDRLLTLLKMEPRDLMRKGEQEYRALKLADPKLTRAQLIAAMVKHPILIERPIVVSGQKAIVARPPERVAEVVRLVTGRTAYVSRLGRPRPSRPFLFLDDRAVQRATAPGAVRSKPLSGYGEP